MSKYSISFKIDDNYAKTRNIDNLEEFYQYQIQQLLDIVIFYNDDIPVEIDSFVFINNKHRKIKIYE